MTNYTTDLYEVKREIVKFSSKLSKGLNKSTKKFVLDMMYGLAKSKSCIISNIARELDEDIKLKNTIERLCDNLNKIEETEMNQIKENYIEGIRQVIPEEEVVAIFDDSDIAKRYGHKFEDLDQVIDASSQKQEVVSGYHVCEAVILTEKEKQPTSVYSEIYSCKSKDFVSKNKYTMDSINRVREVVRTRCNMVFDRGYDNKKIIDMIDKNGDYFVIRMKDNRNFKFKGKIKNCYDMAIERKGKVRMKLLFDDNEEHEVSLSHTKVELPYNKREYELVIVYGLDESHPMILLTNRSVNTKEELIKVVRLYFSRWRVEEYFRNKKQEYDFENLRVRTLKSMNSLNSLLMMYLGYVAKLTEEMDRKLLTVKIIERSKSLRRKVVVWLGQIGRGIAEILRYAKKGIQEFNRIEVRPKMKQLSLF